MEMPWVPVLPRHVLRATFCWAVLAWLTSAPRLSQLKLAPIPQKQEQALPLAMLKALAMAAAF
jgi:hypothetical protein